MSTYRVSVGISMGSESACVAVNTAVDRYEVVANDAGDRTTATYMALVGGEMLYGSSAKNAFVRYPMQTVAHVLPMISPEIVNANTFRVGCEVDVRGGGDDEEERVVFPSLDVDDEEAVHDAVSILTQFLTRFRAAAVEGACGGSTPAAVTLAIPRYLSATPYAAILESAGFAGSLQVIYADTAAALAYVDAIPRSLAPSMPENQTLLVVDWGAKTLCISLMRYAGGSVEHVSHRVSYTCGGIVIDKEIQNYGAQCFQKKTRMDPRDNARSMRKLLLAAEEKKKALSATTTSNMEIEAFCEGIDLKEPLSRVKIESIVREKDLCGAFDRLLDELMDDAVATATTATAEDDDQPMPQITKVIFSGGTLRIPMLSQYVRGVAAKLPQVAKWKAVVADAVSVLDQVPSDEVTATGACVQATALATKGGSGAPQPPSNGTMVLDSEVASTRALSTSLYWFTGLPKDLEKQEKSWTTAASKVRLLFPAGTPSPMDTSVELSEPLTAPTALLVVAGNIRDNVATVNAVMREKLICPAGVKKFTWILSEDLSSATVHILGEDAAGKKTLLTRGKPIELQGLLAE